MTKQDLIQLLANVGVPSGATLVWRDLSSGLRVAKVPRGSGGIRVARAEMFARSLSRATAKLPEIPNAHLFEVLHQTYMETHIAALRAMSVRQAMDGLILEYREGIEKLRKAAEVLGISYTSPNDPILEE